jgi:hypothetical protein
MLTMTPANFGRHDKRTSQKAIDQAMTRLVARGLFQAHKADGGAHARGSQQAANEAAEPVGPNAGRDILHVRTSPARVADLLTGRERPNRDTKCHEKRGPAKTPCNSRHRVHIR